MKRRPSSDNEVGKDNKKQNTQVTSSITSESTSNYSTHLSSGNSDTDTINEATELWITIIDVGQGESTLIRYRESQSGKWEDKQVVLVDGGRSHFAEHTIDPTLKALGVKKIDIMVCSHYDADHMEGLTALLKKYTPDKLYERSLFVRGEDDKVKKFRQACPKNREAIKVDREIKLGPNCLLKCVHVDTGALWKDENDYSIGLLLKYGQFSFYLGGDLTSLKEDGLNLDGHVCAFKCGHHGSKHSTSENFLTRLKPTAAFISAANHSYCHPDDETIARLCKHDAVKKIYLTNCVYNRAGVNSKANFKTQEQQLKIELHAKITSWLNTNRKLLANKPTGFDKILELKSDEKSKDPTDEAFKNLFVAKKLEIKSGEIRKHLPEDKKARKCWNDLANHYYAAHDLYTHLDTRSERKEKGIIAATRQHLGNVHLIVSGKNAKSHGQFNVYYSDGTNMKMIVHECEKDPAEALIDRTDVKFVKRPASYEHTASFSLITGPAGEEREKLPHDEQLDLADMIGDLLMMIDKNENEDFAAGVKCVLDGDPPTDYPGKDLDKFIALYEDSLQLYHELLEKKYTGLKNPTAEAKKALKQATKDTADQEEQAGSDYEEHTSDGD